MGADVLLVTQDRAEVGVTGALTLCPFLPAPPSWVAFSPGATIQGTETMSPRLSCELFKASALWVLRDHEEAARLEGVPLSSWGVLAAGLTFIVIVCLCSGPHPQANAVFSVNQTSHNHLLRSSSGEKMHSDSPALMYVGAAPGRLSVSVTCVPGTGGRFPVSFPPETRARCCEVSPLPAALLVFSELGTGGTGGSGSWGGVRVCGCRAGGGEGSSEQGVAPSLATTGRELRGGRVVSQPLVPSADAMRAQPAGAAFPWVGWSEVLP